MTNAIGFLEHMGRMSPSPTQYAAGVASLKIDARQRRALLDRDQDALTALLAGRKELRCAIFAADED